VSILIKIKNLNHVYNYHKKDQIKALDSINLEIKNGDFVSIIGSNGSGKSTLAKHLNCLLLPTTGDIWVDKMNTKNKKQNMGNKTKKLVWYFKIQTIKLLQLR